MKENPYGLRQLWNGQNGKPDWVARGVMILLALMSIGTWYIFFMKYWEQQRVLGQSRQVERRFWASNNLNEGIDQLAKNSVFRTVAETGVRASSGGSGMVNLNDWIAMSLNRQLEEDQCPPTGWRRVPRFRGIDRAVRGICSARCGAF